MRISLSVPVQPHSSGGDSDPCRELQPPEAVQSGVPTPASPPSPGFTTWGAARAQHSHLSAIPRILTQPSEKQQQTNAWCCSRWNSAPCHQLLRGKNSSWHGRGGTHRVQIKATASPQKSWKSQQCWPSDLCPWPEHRNERRVWRDRDRAQSRDEQLGVLRCLWSIQALTWRQVALLSTEPASVKFI